MPMFKHHLLAWEVGHPVDKTPPPRPKPVAPKPAPAAHAAHVAQATHEAAHAAPTKAAAAPAKDKADLMWAQSVHGVEHGGAEPHIKAAVQVALRQMLGHHVPQDDAGKTHSRHQPVDLHGKPRDRDFGHRPVDLGPVKPGGKEPGPSMYALNTATPGKPEVVWADNGRRISGSQWAAMEPHQRTNIAAHVEPAHRAAFTQHMDSQAAAFPDPKQNPSVRPDLIDHLHDAGAFLQGAWDHLKAEHQGHPKDVHAARLEQAQTPVKPGASGVDVLNVADKSNSAIGTGKDLLGKVGDLNRSMSELVNEQAQASLQHGVNGLKSPPGAATPTGAPATPPAEAPKPGTVESRLGAVTGGLSTLMAVANLYNDLGKLKGGDWRDKLDLVSHSTDLIGGAGNLLTGLANSGAKLPPGVVTALNNPVTGKVLEKVGGVGLITSGITDMSRNAEEFELNPTFGNTLGMEIGALKTSAGAAITSGGPVAIVYGNGLALTAGGLDMVKSVYDNNPTVHDAVDTAGEFHQGWMGAAYKGAMGIPQEVAAGKAELPHAPAGGWGQFMATHSQAEVAAYYTSMGFRAPGT